MDKRRWSSDRRGCLFSRECAQGITGRPHSGKIPEEDDFSAPGVEGQKRLGLLLLTRDFLCILAEQPHMPRPRGRRPVVGHDLKLHGNARQTRVGIENGHRQSRTFTAASSKGRSRAQAEFPGRFRNLAVKVERVVFGGFDAGPGDHVVKIVEQMGPPGLPKLELRIVRAPGRPGCGAEGLGLHESPETPHGGPLEAAQRRVTAGENPLEFALEDGRRSGGLADCGPETVRRPVENPDPFFPGREGVDPPEVLPRRPAAVVAEPPEDGNVAAKPEGQGGALLQSPFDVVTFGVVEPDGNPVGRDFGPVDAAPAEKIGRKVEIVRLGTHEDVKFISGPVQNLRQTGAVAEGVEVVGDGGPDAELFPEIQTALGDLPNDGLGAGEIDIGLEVPAPGDGPAPGRDQPPDFGKKGGVISFDPTVENGLVVVENEFGVLA